MQQINNKSSDSIVKTKRSKVKSHSQHSGVWSDLIALLILSLIQSSNLRQHLSLSESLSLPGSNLINIHPQLFQFLFNA